MPKLTPHCPLCGKPLVVASANILSDSKLIEYKCGHVFSRDITRLDPATLDFNAVDGSGKIARDYQKDGIQFILESDFNCIIGDQMRLGKTPQALLALKNGYKKRTPALILVRSANLWQWIREYKVWCDALPNGIYPIIGGAVWIPGGFSAYIMSMDTFSSQGKCRCGHKYHENECGQCKKKDRRCLGFLSDGTSMVEKLARIPFKLIIADEAHSFKNTDSNRSQALVSFVSRLNTGESNTKLNFTCNRCAEEWTVEGKITFDKRIGHEVTSKSSCCPKCGQYCYVQLSHNDQDSFIDPKTQERYDKLKALAADTSTTPHERALALSKAQEVKDSGKIQDNKPCGLILLTGTAIKNRAEEYFVPLNLVNPTEFSSLEQFRRRWLEQNSKGQWSRIKEYQMSAFKSAIAPYVLRREKEDVYKDLPALNRIFTLIEPSKDVYTKMYNDKLDSLETKLADRVNPSYWDFAEDLMELRRICGLMKLPWVSDYLEVSLLDSENQRYAVGIHHKSVRDLLYMKLGAEANCIKLSGEDSAWQKDRIMKDFANSRQRCLIINMLAGGVGMDFHYVNNCIILERQWSSADEEQFEFRFYNPDKSIKTESTTIEYVLAKGTIDQFFHDMIEEKRIIFGETISNNWSITSDTGSFKDLCERTLAGRL